MESSEAEVRRPSSEISLKLYCYRCGHLWSSRKDGMPKTCPRCKSSQWDTPVKKDTVCIFCGERWYMSKLDEPCPSCNRSRIDGIPSDNILHCNQCDYEWAGRFKSKPKKCPLCKSLKWSESKASQFTCHRCSHVWRNRSKRPERCPKCQSTKWDVPAYKLQCRRCGYKWMTKNGRTSEEINMCPSCKSRKWNETPNLKICKDCGAYYIGRIDKPGCRCTSCTSKKKSFKNTCEFCNANWSTTTDEWTICPRCGKSKSDENDEKTLGIWSDGRFSLKYVYTDDFSFIYLWEGEDPVATMYFHDLLGELSITADQFTSLISDNSNSGIWKKLSDLIYDRRDEYLQNVSYFMRRLNISESDAKILSIHFTGMGPEAIAVKFGISLDEVRRSFDRIMEAYIDNGIVVNDSIFTDDPISYY